ncbi:MAG: undecaprenyldiphospho-muramoylpentapeptide beta-N-acetylglucosaminyltransferase [Candidatus Harrisonbacteria bacterium]|nr:undecaprenyldiphospho-muramoylpentapeptide beta-N-acetylglucosaminyltransferase [Candidatus Harrisonbacteria bacterium]
MKKLRILLTGGGTGGHIFPLIAVANELRKQADNFEVSPDLRYFGSARKYAREIVENDIEFVPILSGKWRRYWSLLNLLDMVKFLLSFPRLLWKIFWFMPEVTFSKGGPGALAAILVSRFYRIPVIIHESDSLPGLTNKISASFSKKIFVAFASAIPYFKNKNIEVVGNPVRESLFANLASLKLDGENEQAQARKGFGLNPNEPVILVLGGSQGAEKLNNFILENLEILTQNFQILHQAGEGNYDSYKKEFEFTTKDWSEVEKNRYIFRPFFDKDLGDALISADLVVSRAGAGSIFELAAFGRPAMLVPLPESANGHQKENARLYAETGAAIVIQEENLLGNLVAEELQKLIANPELLKKMSDAAKSFYRPDAASVIAKYLLTYV